jgi:hypothetical protein
MFLIFFLVVVFLFAAVASIAVGLVMLLGAVLVAFLVVTMIFTALAAWKGPQQ